MGCLICRISAMHFATTIVRPRPRSDSGLPDAAVVLQCMATVLCDVNLSIPGCTQVPTTGFTTSRLPSGQRCAPHARQAVVPCCSHGAPRNFSLLASQVFAGLMLGKLPPLETPKRNHHAHIWSGTLCRLGLATRPHFNIALVVRKREQTGKAE